MADSGYAMRYWLSEDSSPWREISREEFTSLAKSAGFNFQDDLPDASGFGFWVDFLGMLVEGTASAERPTEDF